MSNQAYNTHSSYYGTLNKRDTKAFNKLQEGAFHSPQVSVIRWQNPIPKQEINQFYSQYKDFIDAAKRYREEVLGYRDEKKQEAPKR
jgi:hypothetical protein